MDKAEKLKEDFIMNFGWAYKAFGLSKLMGHVVALLLFSPKPLSLDEITESLKRSKGPVSQITRRLRDKNLIRRVWQPTSRKDYYEIQPDIFENAFRNNLEMVRNNYKLAQKFRTQIKDQNVQEAEILSARLEEMQSFYELMDKKYREFLDEWDDERAKLLG
ncbi:MAG: MarR family transcriptional regulator [Ignavibacteriae bacterium HGW-Ignavibacteriae-2]|jgi:DNA-binding transcriptional regulator GbsR (MarR family)|nr:MarR family transcriptional regulator [Bacteroidota bacterium]PKL89752.1 MAG: MarR family transcriptional regulator [Ignavibacteriae bacterium HGW-Ignavibacteriae-2]